MGKRRSVDSLSISELKDQLKGCWEHFKRCLAALNGEKDEDGNDIEPCELEELAECDSDSDDLELFYQCKSIGERKNECN